MDRQQVIWLQRERENDPQTGIDAQRRLDAWRRKVLPYEAAMEAAAAKAIKATTNKNKVKLLREMADRVAWGWSGISPCKESCPHCCHMPTLMTQEEADVIGAEIGRPAKQLLRYSHQGNMAYYRVPCPFLKDGRCSIYRYRPIVCRLHVSIDKDDLLCNTVSDAKQPQWDSEMFHLAEAKAFSGGMTRMPRLGDIREFFK